jgi:hypothetical protein
LLERKSSLKVKGPAGEVAQVIEYLPSKCEALSSNSSTASRKKGGGGLLKVLGQIPYLPSWDRVGPYVEGPPEGIPFRRPPACGIPHLKRHCLQWKGFLCD